jgi:hypothetical protein
MVDANPVRDHEQDRHHDQYDNQEQQHPRESLH